MLRRFLMNRLQEVNRNPQDGQVLRERLEHGDVRTDDRHVLATIVRATYASQERLQASRPSAHTTPQPKAHIGGNQVIGFSSSRTTDGGGRLTTALVIFSLPITCVLFLGARQSPYLSARLAK